ncbi:hypothetical protein KK083_03980 [Fulvivirgaceae bacterium PWU4]|uniref:Uncharacterized protein n=1 Tax=Chryseosolibacter histidini TaxID=2782349 RepID=A0AAP2GN14_9BACT|nr:hypothetical protein [Chryseosolibacter histidini]MBT1696022.1 hypothetical protein [Chryseosolibacter histidini]
MTTTGKNNFITPTLKFCIAGVFIPGFTAIFIFALQKGLTLLNIECSNSWTILWTLTAVGAVVAPIVFVRKINKWLSGEYSLITGKLLLFNFLEYIFLQCALAAFFTNGHTLCYVTDGQNGLEIVFTGWMALPILIMFSLAFDTLRKSFFEEKE